MKRVFIENVWQYNTANTYKLVIVICEAMKLHGLQYFLCAASNISSKSYGFMISTIKQAPF